MRSRGRNTAKKSEKSSDRRMSLDFLPQPGPSIGPQPSCRSRRDAQGLGGIRNGKAGEIAEVNEIGGGLVGCRQFHERLVQSHQVLGYFRRGKLDPVQVFSRRVN